MTTVVDLLPPGSGTATAINKDGFVTFNEAGFTPRLFIPASANDSAGSDIALDIPLNMFGLPVGVSGAALGLNNLVDNPDVVGWLGISLAGGGSVRVPAVWFACSTGGTSGTLLETLGGAIPSLSQANGINDGRMIAGWSVNAAGVRRAVIWNGNAGFPIPLELDPLDPALASEALAINNAGTAVGFAQALDPSGTPVEHAIAWDTGTRKIVADFGTMADIMPVVMTDLHTRATAINAAGVIVGVGDVTNGSVRQRVGFHIPVGGIIQPIPAAPGPAVGAWGLAPNANIVITIPVVDLLGPTHGATYAAGGVPFDINLTPGGFPGGVGLSGGWTLLSASGINDAGEICGVASTPVAANHPILIVP